MGMIEGGGARMTVTERQRGGDRKCESEARNKDEMWESHGEVR